MRRMGIILTSLLFFLTACSQSNAKWQAYSTSSFVKDSFLSRLKLIPAEEIKELDEDFPAVAVPYQLGDTIFANPEQEAGIIECQCSLEKDTLTIAIGVGFYGGAYFVARATQKLANSYFTVWSEEPEFKRKTDGDWQKEIELPAESFKLVVSKKFPLKINEEIYGIWEASYPEYYFKEEDITRAMKSKLKFYFSCKIDVKIY